TRQVVIIPIAEEELLAAAAYYEERAPGLGAEFLATARKAVKSLQEPTRHVLRVPGTAKKSPLGRIRLSRFPYGIIFLLRDDVVFVVAFAHHRRRPHYWRKRVRTI